MIVSHSYVRLIVIFVDTSTYEICMFLLNLSPHTALSTYNHSNTLHTALPFVDAAGRTPADRFPRTDVLRKRLAGVFAETTLPASGYTAEDSRKTSMAL